MTKSSKAAASTLPQVRAISSRMASTPWRTMISLPSAKRARYAGSRRFIGSSSERLLPAARSASSTRSGMVITVGPVSKVNPSCLTRSPRPPGAS